MTELAIGRRDGLAAPVHVKVWHARDRPCRAPAHQIALENDQQRHGHLGARLLEPQPAVQETLGAVLMRNQGGIVRCKAW